MTNAVARYVSIVATVALMGVPMSPDRAAAQAGLRVEDHYADNDGVRIHYVSAGPADPKRLKHFASSHCLAMVYSAKYISATKLPSFN